MSAQDKRSPSRGRGVTESSDKPDSGSSSREAHTLSGSTPRNASLDRAAAPVVDEQSPLLSASGSEHCEEDGLVDDQTVLDEYDEYQVTKSVWYLILLTVSIGGLQIAWAVELSNGSPYLLSLGVSKSLMALVWIAGPLSGSLVQPYVGIRSDNCRISWGKRKPFMLAGTGATILSLLALAWAREIVGGFLNLFGAERDSQGVKTSIIVFAVLFVYILDFAINTGKSPEEPSLLILSQIVQAGIRAFIVDCAPTHQQGNKRFYGIV
jgi:solute carrier family 45, member 1/2/4